MDAAAYVRICLDPIRLAVLGRAAAGESTDGLAATLGVPERKIAEERGRLIARGLIDADDGSLDHTVLRSIAETLPQNPLASAAIIDGEWTEEEVDVLGRFFSGARLREIPSARAKRLIVLERLSQEFEPGVRYSEAEVNFTLQLFHADYAALRRYLVDEELLTRADGVYWRTGGRYRIEEDHER
jgi:hypothetical protein